MPVARLMKLGGSVALTIPSRIMKEAHFEKDMDVKIDVEDGAVIIRRARKRRTLQELLAECDLSAQPSTELAAFDASPTVGGELI